MDGFNVPMLSDNGYSSNSSNNTPQTHTHHHKDQMLSAGSAPATPFIYDHPASHKGINQVSVSLKSTNDYATFTNCIQQSALLDHRTVDANIDGVSLSSLCDLKFPSSPSGDSNFKNISLINIEANQVLVPAKGIAANDLITDGVGNGIEPTFSNILYAKDDVVIETKDMRVDCDAAQVTHVTHYLPLKAINDAETKFPKATVTATAAAAAAPTVTTLNASAMAGVQTVSTKPSAGDGGGRNNNNNTSGRMKRGNAGSRNGRTAANRQRQQQQQQQQQLLQQQQQQQQLQIQPAEAITHTVTTAGRGDYLSPSSLNVFVTDNQALSDFHNSSADNRITTTTSTIITTATASSKSITTNANNNFIASNHSQIASGSCSNAANTTNTNSTNNNSNNNCNKNNVQNMNSIATMGHNRATVLQPVVDETKTLGSPTQQQPGQQQQPRRPAAVIVSTLSKGSCISKSNSVNININHANNNNSNVSGNNSTMSPISIDAATEPEIQQSPQQQQQQQQQQQRQKQLQQMHSANVSTECDSLSSMDMSDGSFGYQDNTSSHSQQSVSGGGGGGGPGSGGGGSSASSNVTNVVLLNGSNPNAAGGYMTLLPPATSSGQMGISAGGTSASAGGGSGEGIDFKHLFEELCPVCGDKVSGYHYGLLTCESCKGFFKRTVQNKKVYTCVAERSCHIDKTQRKRCPYCRFQKCLEVGMKLEAVRADRMRGGRNKFGPMYKRDRARKLQMMRQRQLALQALRTSIGSVEMKSSPLSPGYQQAYPNMNIKQEIQIPQVSSLTQSPDSSPSPIAIALGQVNTSGGVISTPMNGGGGGGSAGGGGGGGGGNGNGGNTGTNNSSSNNASDGLNRGGSGNCHDTGTGSLQNASDAKIFDTGTHPSSTADSIIEPLRVSPMIRDFVQSIDDREWQTQLFALLQKQTYNQVEVDLFELMCKVLDQNLFSQVDWARNTVFFKDLKVDDQMKLLQHSWSDMLVLDHLHQRIHNGLPDETQLNNGQVFNLLWLGLLGVPQLSDYFNELQNRLQDLKFDMGDYVCMKFLILLNPDVRGIVNKKTVLEGQENVQAALLDYTLTCYPSVTDKFRRLLSILPDIHAMASRGEDHLYSKHCAGSAPTQTLLMEMLHAKRKA
ncbi:PREDICTED: nuclear hormone receptor FTZ-F1-like isoform X2 [Rhagoletis zephyria]|uniref:nuclear hormone receptor FTZ-F1-like isoform X2 n=1 Tax=Rhagoletis zephyria TaxID=28612 RepID=UPI000811A787|nr:PREDICTED: nuclear hormone receptor FTZ-F1-like isoform X2 [Rhagoletis zephyria]